MTRIESLSCLTKGVSRLRWSPCTRGDSLYQRNKFRPNHHERKKACTRRSIFSSTTRPAPGCLTSSPRATNHTQSLSASVLHYSRRGQGAHPRPVPRWQRRDFALDNFITRPGPQEVTGARRPRVHPARPTAATRLASASAHVSLTESAEIAAFS